ncbi:MAG: OsmC family protein, partial [Rhodospirillaceae bacterium]|nr:OsmC family protein [Rhodospirillaceae bacterium]
MKAEVKWIGGVAFEGTADSGHSVTMDGAVESGGTNKGFRPMELVVLGMGGCTSFDVVGILKKSRQQVSDCVVEITAERAEDTPKVFTQIHMHFKITGKDVAADKVARAISLSADKYCSAVAMLGKTATITHDFEII